jgi:hypothetical protein
MWNFNQKLSIIILANIRLIMAIFGKIDYFDSVRKNTIKFRFGSDYFQSESFLISNSYVPRLNE